MFNFKIITRLKTKTCTTSDKPKSRSLEYSRHLQLSNINLNIIFNIEYGEDNKKFTNLK